MKHLQLRPDAIKWDPWKVADGYILVIGGRAMGSVGGWNGKIQWSDYIADTQGPAASMDEAKQILLDKVVAWGNGAFTVPEETVMQSVKKSLMADALHGRRDEPEVVRVIVDPREKPMEG